MTTTEQQLAELKTEVAALKQLILDLPALIAAGNTAIVDEFRKTAEAKPASKKAAKATESTEQPATSSAAAAAVSKDDSLKAAKEHFNTVWKTLKGEKDTDKLPKREALRKALGPMLDAACGHDDYKATLTKAENDPHSFKVASKLCTIMFKMASDNTKSKSGMTTEQLVQTILDVKASMDAASKNQSKVLGAEDAAAEENA